MIVRRDKPRLECSVSTVASFWPQTWSVKLRREQIQGRKDKAARFTETVLGDPERAQEIRDESLEDYAARRKFAITNPRARRRAIMPRKTIQDYRAEIAELKDQVEDLESETESLQEQLDQVAEIVSPEEEEEEEDEDEDDLD